MEKFLKDNWKWILLSIVALIVLFIVYRAIKKSGEKPHQTDIDEDVVGSDIPSEDVEMLKALAENLHEDIFCIWCTRNKEIYSDLSILSNNYLVAVSNIYNEIYEINDSETFYQAMNNEYYSLTGGDKLRGLVDGILSRLRDLGVS